MKLRLLSAAFLAIALASASAASAKVVERWNDLQPHPRFIRYDQEKDVIFRYNSIFSTALEHRKPGGPHSYSGNRLDSFQYRGKRGTGGLYDALDDYKQHLDPRHYQFRRGKAY